MGKDADCCDTCRDLGHVTEAAPIAAATPLTGAAVTLVIRSRGRDTTVVLSKPEVIIGRSSACDLQLDDSALSRRQCVLRITPDRVTIEDLKSSCGTYLDDRHTHGPTEVGAGGVLRMGSTMIRVLR